MPAFHTSESRRNWPLANWACSVAMSNGPACWPLMATWKLTASQARTLGLQGRPSPLVERNSGVVYPDPIDRFLKEIQ